MVFKLQVLLLNGQVSRDIHISIYICMCVYDEVFHRALFRPCALHSFSSFLRGEEKKARANLKLAKTPTGKIVLLEKNASCRHWLQQFSFRSTMTRFLGKRYKKKKKSNLSNTPLYAPADSMEQENIPPPSDSNQDSELDSRSALVDFFESAEVPEKTAQKNGKRDRQVRFADKTNFAEQFKQSLEEKLQASQVWIDQLQEENRLLKEKLELMKDQQEMKEKVERMTLENNELGAEVLEWKAKFYESETERERLTVRCSQLKDEYEKMEQKVAQQPPPSCVDAEFRSLINKLTRMHTYHSKHNDREYYRCDIQNEDNDRSITFELYIDQVQEEIEYVPVHMKGISQKLPSYLQDNISFDVQNAPIFFTKIMHSLFSK